MLSKASVNVSYFLEIFKEFNQAVKEGECTKLDYPIWTVINTMLHQAPSTALVEVYFHRLLPESSFLNLYIDDIYISCPAKAKDFITFIWGDLTDDGEWMSLWDYIDYTESLPIAGPHYKVKHLELIDFDNATPQDAAEINLYLQWRDCNSINANNITEEKGDNAMNTTNIIKNFDFGPVKESNNVKLSMYGLAVKNNSDTWVAYDAASERIIDVDILSFNINNLLYKIPVAISAIAVGDVIVHNRYPVFVTAIENNKIKAIDPASGEEKTVLLTRSPFGFDFATKIVNLLGNFTGMANADANNPFGNMFLPLMLSQGGNSLNDMLPLLMMGGNGANANSMLPLLLLSNNSFDGDTNPLTMLALSAAMTGNTTNPFAAFMPTATN